MVINMKRWGNQATNSRPMILYFTDQQARYTNAMEQLRYTKTTPPAHTDINNTGFPI